MILLCKHCSTDLLSDSKNNQFYIEMQEKTAPLVVLKCHVCKRNNYIKLQKSTDKQQKSFRCPKQGCTGWVSYVESGEEPSFWGCGECSTAWSEKEELFSDISCIVEKYPYRRKSYVKAGNGWKPAALEKEYSNYEEKVEKEDD